LDLLEAGRIFLPSHFLAPMGKLLRLCRLCDGLNGRRWKGHPAQFIGVGKLIEIPEAKMIHEILRGFIEQRSARNFGAARNLDEAAIEQRLHYAIHCNASNGFNVGACDGLAVGNDCERFEAGARVELNGIPEELTQPGANAGLVTNCQPAALSRNS
jgi:hypothetical protein